MRGMQMLGNKQITEPSAPAETDLVKSLDEFLKATMDYTLAFVGIVLISPLLLVLAIIVKLDSPGPVIHRRRVMGRGGTQFDAFKFRTMVGNGGEILKPHP